MAGIFAKDEKAKLNYFCMKFINRQITKNDIVYSCGKLASGKFQSTVTLNCLNEAPMYAGLPSETRDAAEKEAAKQALLAHKEDVQKLEKNPMAFSGFKRKCALPSQAAQKAQKVVQAGDQFTYKLALFESCSKICKRTVNKIDDIVYNTEKSGAHMDKTYVVTITLPVLADLFNVDLGEFSSEPLRNMKDAEHAAAEKAFTALLSYIENQNPAWKPHLTKVLEKREVYLANKKEVMDQKKARSEEMFTYDEMVEWCQAKGGGKGIADTLNLRRFPISDNTYVGKVKSVQKEYGLIGPIPPIQHPKAGKRGGDVRFAMKDVVGAFNATAPRWLRQGVNVTFKVYAEATGLGAEEVTVQ